MRDKGRIFLGLGAFLVLISFPIWYNVATGQATYAPELAKVTKATECVRDSAWMNAHHMDLLDEWRDRVVREGERFDVDAQGRPVEMSLTHTCLNCHEQKAEFCDKCHNFVSVDPFCWDCHVDPKEIH